MRTRTPVYLFALCLLAHAPACGSDDEPTPGADAGDDTATGDGGTDAGEDTTPDIGDDTAPDVTVDTTPDVAPDVAPDTTPDVSPDTPPDVAPDVAPDTPFDVSPDGDDAACVDPCTLDETRCSGASVETCVIVDGCPVFSVATPCDHGVCSEGVCQDPTCDDGVRNGVETDVDCGGSDCDGCDAGETCGATDDCAGDLVCTEFTDGFECAAVDCSDGVQNGDETDVDCGGSCGGCDGGQRCGDVDDCASGVCAGGFCGFPSCEDGIRNGDETGVDCGAGIDDCPLCADGEGCLTGADCTSGVCGDDTLCAAPSCTDGLLNGDESDADCGGATCEGCPTDAACVTNSDCASGVCDDVNCAAPACDDGIQNGDETDVDCGGATCEPCVAPAPTLSEVSANLFNTRCTPCHISSTSGGLSLMSNAGLRGRLLANSSAGIPYITPGDVSTSYLWHKVSGTQGTVGGGGSRMPLSGGFLNDDELALLRAWIEGGAIE